jgi:hypothetical protein
MAFLVVFSIALGFLGYLISGFGGSVVGVCVGAVVAVVCYLAWLRNRNRK